MTQLVDIAKALIEHAAWPLLIGIVVLVYHSALSRILDELSGLINRSYYRFGSEDHIPAQKDAKSIGGDEKEDCDRVGTEMFENGDVTCKSKPNQEHSSYSEHQFLERLKTEYGVPVFERQTIGVSNYYFDAVMEYKGRLYGIEIRGVPGHSNWERIFDNVQRAYDGFIPEHKKRFVFMLCVGCGNDKEEDGGVLRNMVRRHDFTTVIKYY